MPIHSDSITVMAAADIDEYAIVKLSATQTNELPMVEMCDGDSDTIFGVAKNSAETGELLTVDLPFSGILTVRAYSSVKPGQGLTIGLSSPGAMSNNTDDTYARKIAYVVLAGGQITGTSLQTCSVVFVRDYYI